MRFGRVVQECRKAKGWNQAKLGELVGVSRQAIALLERDGGRVSTLAAVEPHLGLTYGLPLVGNDWAERICAARQCNSASVQQIAQRTGLAPNTLRLLGKGKGSVDSLSRLIAFLAPQARWPKSRVVRLVKASDVNAPSFKARSAHVRAVNHSISIGNATLYLGDARDIVPSLGQIDACVADPPYGLGFMGKPWDDDVPDADLWRLVHEALKPGAFLLSFSGSRTYHRAAIEIEQAGFDILDQLLWLHGEGMPKSRSIAKDIDRLLGAEREVVGSQARLGLTKLQRVHGVQTVNVDAFPKRSAAPITPEAKEWDGFGIGLKPAHEPVVMARKPFEGSVASNILGHRTGGLNIDASRVSGPSKGRYPANVIHDGSDDVLALFPQSKSSGSSLRTKDSGNVNAFTGNKLGDKAGTISVGYGDQGSAARYFYCAKVSKKERAGHWHPTMKPLNLMKYLCRLVTPPGGTILDPFMGAGTTGIAAIEQGFRFIGIERDPDYFEMAQRRFASLEPAGAAQG